MSPEQVVENLSKRFGIKASARNILHLAERNLLPRPSTGSLGRGKGTFSEYPDDLPEKYYSVWRLNKHAGMSLSLQEGLPAWQSGTPFGKLGAKQMDIKPSNFGPQDLLSIQQLLWLTFYRLAELNVPARSEVSIQIKISDVENYMVKIPQKPFKPDATQKEYPKLKVVVDRAISSWPKSIEVWNDELKKWEPLQPINIQ